MNQYYPLFGGYLKYFGVAAHSIGLMVALHVALRSILALDIQRHRAWMMRAIAIGLSPATQRVFILPIFLINGKVGEFTVGLIVWFALLLNLFLVEWILNRERHGGLRKIKIKLKEAL